MNLGTSTMVVGGTLAWIGTPAGGVGAGPGIGVVSVGAQIFERGALMVTGGSLLKLAGGDTNAISSLVSDAFQAFAGNFASLTTLGKGVTGAASDAATSSIGSDSPC